MTLDEMLVEEQIRDAITSYCRGIDRGDADLIRSAYHDDAWEDHGSFKGPAQDYAPHVVAKMSRAGTVGHHNLLNMAINRDGDRACVESAYLCLQPYVDEDGVSDVALIGGRYLDRFSCRDGRWAIDAREVLVDWSHAYFAETPWPGVAAYPRGTHVSENDPSWAFFHTA